MGKIILFYKYIDIQYPKQIQKWQQKICQELNLKGRIILATEGINGTLGGRVEDIENYINQLNNHELFKDIDFKESIGNSDCFPKLKILIKDEIVKLKVDTNLINAKNAGKHLSAQETHDLLEKNSENLIILDARNKYESDIGAFKGAVKPNIRFFRDLPKFIDDNLDLFKDKEILMYCTGGIRCERASAYLKSKNISKEVYQIKGGIHKYIEKFPDGFFRGKNYVFDARVSVPVNSDTLGVCYICNIPYDAYTNCMNANCNRHFIACPNCLKKLENSCSKKCLDLINEKKVKLRPAFKFINLFR